MIVLKPFQSGWKRTKRSFFRRARAWAIAAARTSPSLRTARSTSTSGGYMKLGIAQNVAVWGFSPSASP